MENLISRHRNVSILVAVLFAQVLGLAVQVKLTGPSQETRLIRLWTVSAVTPFEKALVWTQQSVWGTWHNYVYLRGVRAENRELKQRIEQMRIEQVRLSQDAEQAREKGRSSRYLAGFGGSCEARQTRIAAARSSIAEPTDLNSVISVARRRPLLTKPT